MPFVPVFDVGVWNAWIFVLFSFCCWVCCHANIFRFHAIEIVDSVVLYLAVKSMRKEMKTDLFRLKNIVETKEVR